MDENELLLILPLKILCWRFWIALLLQSSEPPARVKHQIINQYINSSTIALDHSNEPHNDLPNGPGQGQNDPHQGKFMTYTSSPPADCPSWNSPNSRTSSVTSQNYNRWNVWPNKRTKLLSAAGTGYFYTARRNVTRSPEKFKMVKFDPMVRRRVLFTEHKIK